MQLLDKDDGRSLDDLRIRVRARLDPLGALVREHIPEEEMHLFLVLVELSLLGREGSLRSFSLSEIAP